MNKMGTAARFTTSTEHWFCPILKIWSSLRYTSIEPAITGHFLKYFYVSLTIALPHNLLLPGVLQRFKSSDANEQYRKLLQESPKNLAQEK